MLKSNNHTLNGMTLLELMIALTLTLMIAGSLSAIYIASAKNHLTESALQNIQQNSRITLALLDAALRSAGNIGCAKLTNDYSVISAEPYTMTTNNRIRPYYSASVKSGTDGVTVRYANAITSQLVEPMHSNNTLVLHASFKVAVDDVLLISDCRDTDIFTVQQVISNQDNQTIVANDNLNHLYQENAEVSQFEINTYYIGKTDRKTIDGKVIYALYMQDRSSRKIELVEGVDSMTIRYVENVNEFNANQINDWSKVKGVSMKFEFSSLNHVPLSKTIYRYIALREI